MRRLYLVRHGHTIWNDTGGVAGSTDIDLSDEGRDAVAGLALSLSGNCRIGSWFCSPMKRTRETSLILRTRALAENRNSVFPAEQFDSRLVELNFGDWEGMTWSEVHEKYSVQMNEWGQDWVNRAPPDGETFSEQAHRCNDWLTSWIAQTPIEPGDVASSSRSALLVIHGGSIRALVCNCLGWPLERAMSFRVDPATLCMLQQNEPSEPWYARLINSRHF